MLQNILSLNPLQRRLVFFMIFFGGILLLLGITWLLVRGTLGTGERQMAQVLTDGYTVREFVALPDDDAYPPSVAVDQNGTVYTGSYATGAVWAISADGATVTEIPNTRESIGAVVGIAVLPDQSLLVVDQIDTDPRTQGGKVYSVTPSGEISVWIESIPEAPGFVAPNDIALDGEGRVYVTDPGRNQVWRWNADATHSELWFVPPVVNDERASVTGIGYDATTNSMVLTDPELNRIWRVDVDSGETSILFNYEGTENFPGFDGVTVTPDGAIYVAALGQNGIARIENEQMYWVVGLFRGSSDVEFAAPNHLYVTNYDQTSIVIPIFTPQLPFALDVIDIMPTAETTTTP